MVKSAGSRLHTSTVPTYLDVYLASCWRWYLDLVRIDKISVKTRQTILPDLIFECWKQTQYLCASLYITICNTCTKQYIYKTKSALLHHSSNVYGGTCMYKGHLNITVFIESYCGQDFFHFVFVVFNALLAGRLMLYKWNQAWLNWALQYHSNMKMTIFCQSICHICCLCHKELVPQFHARGFIQVLLYTLLWVAERVKIRFGKRNG